MKRLTALLSAVTLLLTATACKNESESSQESSTAQQGEALIPVLDESTDEITAFKSEYMSFPKEGTYIGGIRSFGEDRYLLTKSDDSGTYEFLLDADFRNAVLLNPAVPAECDNEGQNYFEYAPEGDGTVYALVRNITHGGMTAPVEYDESFDYDAYNKAEYTSLYLVHYDKDFNILSSVPLTALTDYVNGEGNNFVSTMCPLMQWDETTLLISKGDREFILIDKATGEQTGEIDLSGIDFLGMSLFTDRDGKILSLVHNEESMEILEIDRENKKPGSAVCTLDDSTKGGFLAGTGDYRFFIGRTDGLYGYTDDGKLKLVMNWLDSGIDSNNSFVNIACDDGSFIVTGNEDGTPSLKRYIRKKPEELKEVQKVTLSVMDGNYVELSTEITDFNKNFPDYSVVTKVTSSYDQLKLDIISGEAPDIIYFGDDSFIQQVSDKGVFADLYEFMENDSEINRDTVLPNILKACEAQDGTLPALPHYFDVEALMIKTKFWDKPSITSHELIELYKSKEDEMVFAEVNNTRSEIFRLLANSGENFVDYEKAECYFDTPEFIEILEFCNTFPEEEEDKPDKLTDPNGLDNYYKERYTWLRDDMALIMHFREFGYLYNYNYNKYASFGEDVTLTGMPLRENSRPMLDFNFTFSIMNTCENKEAAWEFVKYCLKEEYKSDSEEVIQWHHFNILTDSFDRMAEDAQKKQGINESFNGYDIPPLTQEDCDMLKEFILTADIVKTDEYYSQVKQICDEEVIAYFAGEQTAQQTAEYIQNRVSIMLSEQS